MIKKDSDFTCPFMRIKLRTTCKLKSCPYNTTQIKHNCIWKYVCSKNTISITELSIILKKDKADIENIIKDAKEKLIKVVAKQKLITFKIVFKYCYKCGKSYNLKKNKNNYICIENCKEYNIYEHLEKRFNKPISHILYVFSKILGIGYIAKLINVSNKAAKDMYIRIFGDSSLLIKNIPSEDIIFKKRKKILNIRSPILHPEKDIKYFTVRLSRISKNAE